MKIACLILASACLSLSGFGQGQIYFNTTVDLRIVAPVLRDASFGATQGQGPGPGFTAELVLVGANGALTPLLPKTVFGSGVPLTHWFVLPVVITVPDVPTGAQATLRMRVFDAPSGSFENAQSRGQSTDFTITLGGALSPALLFGLTGFSISVPEPASALLVTLAALVLIIPRRF